MTPFRLYAIGIVAAVLLYLGIAGANYLHARDEHNRVAGAQVQQAVDVMRLDRMRDSLAAAMHARLDSIQRLKDSVESKADGTFVDVQVKYRDRIIHDTVVSEIVQAAKADVNACKDGRASCEVRATTAERDAALLRLVVHDRDSTILQRAQAVAIPRSCVVPSVASGIGGLLVGILAAHR